jgi:hypothetical protein
MASARSLDAVAKEILSGPCRRYRRPQRRLGARFAI